MTRVRPARAAAPTRAGTQVPPAVSKRTPTLPLPDAVSPACGTLNMVCRCSECELGDHVLVVINSNRRVGCLVGIYPNHRHNNAFLFDGGTGAGTPDSGR